MKILVTNDDGIAAEGILALSRELARDHDVWILAPDRERSGASHSVNLKEPGKVLRMGPRAFSCSGTPADCVMLAYLGVLDFEPEVVVSGINRGPNLGTDILYSGTCAAARQAALFGFPGIAVSCATREAPFLYRGAASFVRRNFDRLLEYCTSDQFVNVNAPSCESESLEGRWASISRRHYHDGVRPEEDPDGAIICHLEPGRTETIGAEHSDEAIVGAGHVAVSAVLVHPQVPHNAACGEIFR